MPRPPRRFYLFCLRCCARESVQDETLFALGRLHSLAHDPDNDVIRHLWASIDKKWYQWLRVGFYN